MIPLQSIVHRRLLIEKMNTNPVADTWSSLLSVWTLLQMVNYSFSLWFPCVPEFFMGHTLWHPSMTTSGFTYSFTVQPFDHNATTCYPIDDVPVVNPLVVLEHFCYIVAPFSFCFQLVFAIALLCLCEAIFYYYYSCISDSSITVWPLQGCHVFNGALVR